MSPDETLQPLPGARDGAELTLSSLPRLPADVLRHLWDAGHEAALVGGSLRDVLLGMVPTDWDVATSAHPEAVVALFPKALWENRFGTVTIHAPGGDVAAQVTTYRTEVGYADRRRPDEVRFGATLAEDLARRDFTINAVAWIPTDVAAGRGRLSDPYGGIDDLRDRVLRAVGDPAERFAEDALRLLRAVRFAHVLGLRIEPATEAAIRRHASLASGVSGERVRDELMRILRAPAPSEAFRLAERLGLLAVLLPEVAALRGIPQDKVLAGDALDHTLRAVDAVDPTAVETRLAALLHDVGKARTLADGHFIGHEVVGAEMAGQVLRRLRVPTRMASEIVHAVRHHMYAYNTSWTDAAVRRFLRRIGPQRTGVLFELRRADNLASGVGAAGDANQRELEARIAAEHARGDVASGGPLAVDGDDLQHELGIGPGPEIGRLLDRLTEAVLDDPSMNEREALLRLARDDLGRR